MKIKIGNKIYDPNEEPIMVILTDQDKNNILNMPEDNTKYCAFPDHMTEESITEWMKN